MGRRNVQVTEKANWSCVRRVEWKDGWLSQAREGVAGDKDEIEARKAKRAVHSVREGGGPNAG